MRLSTCGVAQSLCPVARGGDGETKTLGQGGVTIAEALPDSAHVERAARQVEARELMLAVGDCDGLRYGGDQVAGELCVIGDCSLCFISAANAATESHWAGLVLR